MFPSGRSPRLKLSVLLVLLVLWAGAIANLVLDPSGASDLFKPGGMIYPRYADIDGILGIQKQGAGQLRVYVGGKTDALRWRRELAEFFHLKPLVSDDQSVQVRGAWTLVTLDDVLPAWTLALAGKQSPTATNCVSTALYLAGAVPDPYSLNATLPAADLFVGDWLERGTAITIPRKNFSRLRVGDVLTLHGYHAYVYLGHGLAFENNSRDSLQTLRFVMLDEDYLPIIPGTTAAWDGISLPGPFLKPYAANQTVQLAALRLLRRPDYLGMEHAWKSQAPALYAGYQEVRTLLNAAWFGNGRKGLRRVSARQLRKFGDFEKAAQLVEFSDDSLNPLAQLKYFYRNAYISLKISQ